MLTTLALGCFLPAYCLIQEYAYKEPESRLKHLCAFAHLA